MGTNEGMPKRSPGELSKAALGGFIARTFVRFPQGTPVCFQKKFLDDSQKIETPRRF